MDYIGQKNRNKIYCNKTHTKNIKYHSYPNSLQAQHLHPLYRHSTPESIGWLPDTFAKSSSHKSLRQSFAARFVVKSYGATLYDGWRKAAAGYSLVPCDGSRLPHH
jgi:hypothetical protein